MEGPGGRDSDWYVCFSALHIKFRSGGDATAVPCLLSWGPYLNDVRSGWGKRGTQKADIVR